MESPTLLMSIFAFGCFVFVLVLSAEALNMFERSAKNNVEPSSTDKSDSKSLQEQSTRRRSSSFDHCESSLIGDAALSNS